MFIVPITGLQPVEPAKGSAQPGNAAGEAAGLPFADVFRNAVSELEQAQQASEKDAYNLAMGQVDNLWEVMVNSQKLATTNELVTQLTTRAVASYKEIMSMQV